MLPTFQQATVLVPGAHSPRVVRIFSWYVRRLFSKRFHAVRLAHGSDAILQELDNHDGPALIALSHSSWWDPLTAVLLGTLCASRSGCAPMDAAMLAKFGFFRKLGIFGIDPDNPRGLPALVSYVLERFVKDRKPTLWITPQGRFADVRDAIVVRPGAAAIASRAQQAGRQLRVIVIAIEYGFWLDEKPEVFIRCVRVSQTQSAMSTADWHRALTTAMTDNAAELATLVRARSPGGFASLMQGAVKANDLVDRTRAAHNA
jgi:1-acyl-sn-glycerol-3-phosphate acyltransferase